ncbi:MAG: SHOCT domain-containing protein [Pseudolysinimonas sp.]
MFTSLALAAPFVHPALGVGFGIFFIIGHVLLFLFIVTLIIGIATRRRRWGHGGMGPWGHGFGHAYGAGYWGAAQASRQAETTLAERFAQGDIDEKEYRARLEVLRANAPQAPTGPMGPQK